MRSVACGCESGSESDGAAMAASPLQGRTVLLKPDSDKIKIPCPQTHHDSREEEEGGGRRKEANKGTRACWTCGAVVVTPVTAATVSLVHAMKNSVCGANGLDHTDNNNSNNNNNNNNVIIWPKVSVVCQP